MKQIARLGLCIVFCCVFSLRAFAGKNRGDGFLLLKNVHLGDVVNVHYKNKNGSYNHEALSRIERALRCRLTGQIHSISPKLLDLIDKIQDHFRAGEVQVVSGYRSPALNASLYESGHKVSKVSPHMFGQAMDIRIPGVSSEAVRDYARKLKKGGVGYYPVNGFVHVDVGLKRYWEDPPNYAAIGKPKETIPNMKRVGSPTVMVSKVAKPVTASLSVYKMSLQHPDVLAPLPSAKNGKALRLYGRYERGKTKTASVQVARRDSRREHKIDVSTPPSAFLVPQPIKRNSLSVNLSY